MKDPPQALAALDEELARRPDGPPIEALVLRAHLLSEAHQFQTSVPLWDKIALHDTSLKIFAERSAIADLLARRDVEHAWPRIRSLVGPRPRVRDDAMLLSLADAYCAAGQPARASEIYRGVLVRERQTAIADRARLGLAASEEAAGRLNSALAVLHQATITWRRPDTFSTARSEERRVAARLHRDVAAFTPQQYFVVAARLTAVSCFDEAIALLEDGRRQQRLPAGDKLEAAIIENLYRGRRNEAALARAGKFLETFGAGPLAPSIRLIQLRLNIRLGNTLEARKRLEALQGDKNVPAKMRRSAQRLVAADLVATGAARDGLAIYREVLRAPLARRDRFDVLWRAGIAATRVGDDRSAIDLLRQARRYSPTRSTLRSVLYWLAAALERSGNATEAGRLRTELLAQNEYDYYGLRAAERLQTTGTSMPNFQLATLPRLQVSDVAAASAEFKTAMVLAKAGLLADAASMLAAAVARFRSDAGLALLAARAASSVGDHPTAWSVVSTHFAPFLAHDINPGFGGQIPEDLWRMAFPRAYWPEVQAAATKSDVDPLLLLSVMRRESRFVATARSRAGAVGLFQIMPDTVREVVPAIDDVNQGDRLLEAPASADVAARLIKRIATRFGGVTAPVVAAYNAGEDRVGQWWRAAAGIGEDLFVDSIPYGETRQYVREVLANYATYRRLYGAR